MLENCTCTAARPSDNSGGDAQEDLSVLAHHQALMRNADDAV